MRKGLSGDKKCWTRVWCVGALIGCIATVLAGASAASAATPEFLLQMPETTTIPGSGAAELNNPRGIATDPESGHIYVSDFNNARISEYTAWGLFVKSWGWGVADGSAALQACGPSEPDGDPEPSLCQAGIPGPAKSQLDEPTGIAVDPVGDVYVFERGNLRVQKFNSDAEVVLTFGGDVNKTKVEEGAPAAQRNVCPIDPSDICQKGTGGEGPSQFSSTLGDFIAYSPAEGGTILVGDKGGIQVFSPSGAYVKTIAFEGPLAAFAGHAVNALDVDEGGSVYFSLDSLSGVYKLSSAGAPVAPGSPGETLFEVDDPLGLAVNISGDIYALEGPVVDGHVVGFDPLGQRLIPTALEEEKEEFFPDSDVSEIRLTAIATGICDGSDEPGNLFIGFFKFVQVSHVDAYGTAPIGCEDPPVAPPEVVAQFATSVGREEATVKARINPRFWPDATYYVEYGTGRCSEGGCSARAPVTAALLTSRSVNAALPTAGVLLEGLAPGATYHYRFVTESEGGGPVFGIDPDGRAGPAGASFEEGLEATFRTFASAGKAPPCANGALRTGQSTKLPDCRAYEMVSPLDKGGGDVALWEGRNALAPQLFEIHQSAPSGDLLTYTSAFAFGEPESAPFVSQYLASRSVHGWSSDAISAPRSESAVDATTLFGNEFQGFSEDLCQAWLRHFSVSTLAPEAVEGYPNLYRRENCAPPPGYEAITTEEPPNRPPRRYFELRVQGFSEDGTHTVFVANDKLYPDAPAFAGEFDLRLYEHVGEDTRFVCYRPNGSPTTKPCAAGTPAGSGGANTSIVHNAVSRDGSRIFWSAYDGAPDIGNDPAAPGQIYVRIDGAETRAVSTTKANDEAIFWTASDDGSKAIFAFDDGPLEDRLYELDVDAGTPTLIAGEVEGPMGASEDASRIYFASKEDLDATGPAVAGDHNLYLYEADPGGAGGVFTLVMDMATIDVGGTTAQPAPIDEVPFQRAARISQDGLHATFVSSVSPTPTGYDNLDASREAPTQQVYLYDAVEEELRCVSCNPSGARPTSENIGTSASPFFAAARIQGWETLLHAPRVLSEDGTRVFFESFEALVPRDTNSNWDVYQWEEVGKGTCKESSETFSSDSGGCVDLISSGLSSAKSTFLDADPSGDNVFFSTQSSLVGSDYGLNDVYVARVGGGFPEPVEEAECEGEACQSPPPPPPELTPSTETSSGAGNVPKSKQRKRRCRKGKRRIKRAGKVRCVKRKAKAKARAGSRKSRRAGQ